MNQDLTENEIRKNLGPWVKGTEGEINMKAFLKNSAGQSMGNIWGKMMSSDWLVRLDLFFICQLGIDSLCAFLEPSLYRRAHVHRSGGPQ